MEIINMIVGALICLAPVVGIFAVIALITTDAKLKSAKQIRENIKNGVYANWPGAKTRRLKIMVGSLAALMIFSICISVSVFIIYINQSPTAVVLPSNIFIFVFIALFAISAIMVVISVFLGKMIK